MADLYLQLREPEKAMEKMKESIDYSPDNPEIKFSMYEKLSQAGYERYARDFCEETSSAKEVIRYYNNKGVVLAKQKNHEEAISWYKNALQLIPGAKDIHKIYFHIILFSFF